MLRLHAAFHGIEKTASIDGSIVSSATERGVYATGWGWGWCVQVLPIQIQSSLERSGSVLCYPTCLQNLVVLHVSFHIGVYDYVESVPGLAFCLDWLLWSGWENLISSAKSDLFACMLPSIFSISQISQVKVFLWVLSAQSHGHLA